MGQQKGITAIIIIFAMLGITAGIGGFLFLRKDEPSAVVSQNPVKEKDSKRITVQEENPVAQETKNELKVNPTPKPVDISPKNAPPKTAPAAEQETAKAGLSGLPIFSEYDVPANLALPFRLNDMSKSTEGLISPFGIVRHSRDQAQYGHGGVDIPLPNGAPLYAVADGLIKSYEMKDGEGGYYLGLLVADGVRQGEGWRFLYEHVYLVPGLKVGSRVKKGDSIATNALPTNRNSHVGLEYLFNNYRYVKNHACWSNFLQENDRKALVEKFNQLTVTQKFIDQWLNAAEEGKYQMRELLNKSKFPSGPQLCYPPGTDARVGQ